MRPLLLPLALFALLAIASAQDAFKYWNYALYAADPTCSDAAMIGVATTTTGCIWDSQAYSMTRVQCPSPDLVDIDPLIQRYACGAVIAAAYKTTNRTIIQPAATALCLTQYTNSSVCSVIGSYYWNRCVDTGLLVPIGTNTVKVYERSFCSFDPAPYPKSIGYISGYLSTGTADCSANNFEYSIGMVDPAGPLSPSCFFGVSIDHNCSTSGVVGNTFLFPAIAPGLSNLNCNATLYGVVAPLPSASCTNLAALGDPTLSTSVQCSAGTGVFGPPARNASPAVVACLALVVTMLLGLLL